MEIEKVRISREEIRRLQKAARDNNKQKLNEWLYQFQLQMENVVKKEYYQKYTEQLNKDMDDFILAMEYTMRNSEMTKWGNKRVKNFFKEVFATMDYYIIQGVGVEGFKKELQEEGIEHNTKKFNLTEEKDDNFSSKK